ncbi:MAG: hypothetical protein HKM04_00510 [Legionellales bacterium]|nr:hypothetical protein [Legionellales bacterium]
MKMNRKTLVKVAGISLIAGALCACSHQNPLTKDKQNTHDAVVFLYNVATKAQPVIDRQYPQYNINDGAAFYILCMSNASRVRSLPEACERFYQDMANVAKMEKDSPYRSVNLADITDATMWHNLQPSYEEYQSNNADFYSETLPTH